MVWTKPLKYTHSKESKSKKYKALHIFYAVSTWSGQAYDALPLQFNELLSPSLLMAMFQSNANRKSSLIGSEGQCYSQAIENGKHSNFTE